MSKVALVTDSTANIPPDVSEKYPIFVAPLQVIWGKDTYRDSIDIHPNEFYERLKTDKQTPSTSQPSPAAFSEIYRQLLDQEYQILTVVISSKLSGTMDSAIQARQHYPNAPIEIVDSTTTSIALGFAVLAAARAAVQGGTLHECQVLAERASANTGILFAVNTLEFLRRGGRIGGAAAFLGTALNLKPILELRGGRVEAVERVRTMSKCVDRLLDLFEERVGGRKPVSVAGLHAAAPEEAKLLVERARERVGAENLKETMLSEISPVLGTHTGPGTLGLGFLAGM